LNKLILACNLQALMSIIILFVNVNCDSNKGNGERSKEIGFVVDNGARDGNGDGHKKDPVLYLIATLYAYSGASLHNDTHRKCSSKKWKIET
jgi:hypothetical protein